MFEYHGWITLRSTAESTDDEPALRLAEIQALADELAGYAIMDLRLMNGSCFLHFGGAPNRAGSHGPAVIDLMVKVGELAPGSYGLLHIRDHDSPDRQFLVYRLARGVVSEHVEDLLSPTVPLVEDVT